MVIAKEAEKRTMKARVIAARSEMVMGWLYAVVSEAGQRAARERHCTESEGRVEAPPYCSFMFGSAQGDAARVASGVGHGAVGPALVLQ